LAYGKIPQLEAQLKETEAVCKPANPMMEEAVTDSHVAQIVSRWTGIPVDKMLEGEREKLLSMEAALAKRVVGQADAVRRYRRRCAARVPACRTRTGRSARSCSSAPPVSARRS
jgi:ATP-dependent Clp protease ATP-binding subunit ClpA